jgi:aryl-alcohol dehydrogenase-like predicted oxidoreductase
MNLPHRRIGPFSVSAIGLGCMNLSHAYGTPPTPQQGQAVLHHALELGVDFFDTAALYGFGANEELVGRTLKPHRACITLASKCGMTGVDGKRVIDGRPDTLKRTCDEALRRLQTDVIDLYYLHRWDRQVPIEDSVGALADLVRAGKIRHIGLSEISAPTLRRAHAVHPIAAVQNEYSLWTREPEIGITSACRELGIALVAFSPLGRGFFGGELTDPARQLEPGDIRLAMPRFQPEHYAQNLALFDGYREIAAAIGCRPAQLALAWLLAKGEYIIPIPGTRSLQHLSEAVSATSIALDADTVARLDALINQHTVSGNRYNDATQAEIDTERFAALPP